MRAHKQKQTAQSNQVGFTIIESLIAIAVVGILMTGIAPVIVLSVGNRVQARRVELATEATRSYIDSVRSRAIEAPKHAVLLDEISTTPPNFNPQRLAFASVAAPTSAGRLTCTQASTATYPYCQNDSTSSLYCFDLDGDGCSSTSFKDMVVQAFRSVSPKGIRSATNTDQGYLLGVRVYRADAFSDTTSLVKSTPDTKRTQATFTGGLGDRKAPLLETTTEISTEQPKFQDFCDRLGGCKKDN